MTSSGVVNPSALGTLSQFYAEGKLKAAAESRFEPDDALNKRITLWQGDITKLAVDGIVNAANRRLLGGGGVDGAIHRAAGPQLAKASGPLAPCETGETKITKAFRLPSKHVLHTVGPIYSASKAEKHRADLASCYRTCLETAKENGLTSIAFNCISTGVYGYPNDEAAEVAVETVKEFLTSDESIDLVIFCIFLNKTLPIYFPPATTNAPADEAKAEAAAGEKKDETTEAAAVQTSNL